MWLLFLAILLGVIVMIWLLGSLQHRQVTSGLREGGDMVRSTALLGAQAMQACMQQSPGTYTQAQLGLPPTAPTGNAWVCQVTAGGTLPGGNAAVLYMNNPPQVFALAGTRGAQAGTSNAGSQQIQNSFANNVAADAAQALSGRSDISVGTIAPNTTILNVTYPAPQQVDLTGDVNPMNYPTPAFAAGVARNAF